MPPTGSSVVRKFNTEGPIRADRHYHIPPLTRIDLDDVLGLIRDEKYFVLHAPRQTGKTSALLALRDLLNSGQAGEFRCVYANVEAGQAMRENVAEGIRTVLAELAFRASVTLDDETLEQLWPDLLARVGPGQALRQALARWSMADCAPAGAADRRDRRADRGHAAVGAAAASHRLRPASVRVPAQHRPVRSARRARLPHPLDGRGPHGAGRQCLQHQVQVATARRLLGPGDAVADWRSTPDRPGRRSRRKRWT